MNRSIYEITITHGRDVLLLHVDAVATGAVITRLATHVRVKGLVKVLEEEEAAAVHLVLAVEDHLLERIFASLK